VVDSRQRLTSALVVVLVLLLPAAGVAEWRLEIHAPASLAGAAERIRRLDGRALESALARAGLALPPEARVTLLAEDDPRARSTPSWVVGLAFPPRDIAIFPARITSYPYDSLESVLRHEVAHLALDIAAEGRPLPRWFHEGVAISVDAGWRVTHQARLLFEVAREPAVGDVETLFVSDHQHETTRAYLLAAVLVADLRQRHGADLPGAVARRVAAGEPFERAFEIETGDTPDGAATRAWAAYVRWTTWIPALTSASALWLVILAVATAAFVARRRRRARIRRRWEEEERWQDDSPSSEVDRGEPDVRS
jgi:hypothetical protein